MNPNDHAYRSLFAAILECAMDDIVDYFSACLLREHISLTGSIVQNYRSAKIYIDSQSYMDYLSISLSPFEIYKICFQKATKKASKVLDQRLRNLQKQKDPFFEQEILIEKEKQEELKKLIELVEPTKRRARKKKEEENAKYKESCNYAAISAGMQGSYRAVCAR